MRQPLSLLCLLALFATSACQSAPVGAVVYRTWCETEERWISRDWHLTAAEAEAQLEAHGCQHPEHVTLSFSTAGPVPDEVSDQPLSPLARRLLLMHKR